MKDAKTFFVEENNNCAEAVLRLEAERLGLEIAEDDVKLVSAFGGGMGCGKTCGALCGALAVLGKLKVSGKAHETPGFKESCGAFVRCFEEKTGSTDCAALKPKYFDPEVRCLHLVELTDELFQAFLKDEKKA